MTNQDLLTDLTTPQGVALLNEQLRRLRQGVDGTSGGASFVEAFFTANILQVAHGGIGQDASAWASGDLLYMSALGVIGHAPFNSVATSRIRIFTSSDTFVAPAGVTKVYITMVGGGGGGGGALNGANAGSGGGGGGMVFNYQYSVTPLSSYTVTIGAGGAGGTLTNDGTDGGSTLFDSLTVVGGNKGLTAGTAPVAAGGLDGSATGTGGGFTMKSGQGAAKTGNQGGGGGGTLFGAGAAGGAVGVNGSAPGPNTGAGGGGGGGSNSGGSGASGLVIIMY